MAGIQGVGFLTRRRALFARVEETAGTAIELRPEDTIIAREITVTPVEAETVERTVIRDFLGNFAELLSTRRATVTIACEFVGGGTGTAQIPDDDDTLGPGDSLFDPNWMPLFIACGFRKNEGRTIPASRGSSTTTGTFVWTPVSAPSDMCTCTILCRVDGIEHKLRGCLGTWSIEFANAAIPVITFTMTGHYANPEDTANEPAPQAVLDFSRPPRLFNDRSTGYIVNTGSVFEDALKARMTAFSVDLGNEVTYREVITEKALGLNEFPTEGQNILITNRAATGSITTEAGTLTQADPWSLVGTGEAKSLIIQHGAQPTSPTNPTNVLESGIGLQLEFPSVTLGQPTYGDDSGVVSLEIPLRFQPGDSGNDEIALLAQ